MQFPSEQQAFRDNRSSNAFANGANQNCGNVLTDRPTTRLHAPPGGKSQIASILSWEPEEPAANVNRRAQREARDAPVPQPAQYGMDPRQQARQPEHSFESRGNEYARAAQAAGGAGGVSSNAYANGANQNCGNVLTDRRTTKVSAPPGGHSSIVFG